MQGYRDIGQILATAREERRLSIAEVAQALHIRPRYLVALEEGALEKLPGFPYAKGYLKRYAIYLSLDRVEMLRRFELVAQEAVATPLFMPHHFSLDKHIHLPLALLLAAAGFVVMMAWAWWFRPEHGSLSVVEPVPEKVMEPPVAVSVRSFASVACLRPQNGLYPPCYWPLPEPEPSMMTIIKP